MIVARINKYSLIFSAVCVLNLVQSHATEPQSTPSPAAPAVVQTAPLETKAKSPKGGKKSREKEATEGTEALDRFEANTIIKSRYNLDGQQLEVDPD